MSKYLLLGLLIVGVAVVSYVGCDGAGARAGVAKDAIIKKLDAALGELNVKRKKIEMKQTELQDKLATLREQRYRTEARLDLLRKKKGNSADALESMRGKVEQVKALVAKVKESSEGTIEKGGKTYTADDIQQTAEDVARMFKTEQTKLASLETSYKALEQSVAFLKQQETTSSSLMKDLKQKISEIDAKKIAVDAVRDSTSIAGDNKSIGEGLEAMAKEIEDLGVDVEAALRIETDRMQDMENTSSVADELLSAPADMQSTEDMLDKLLQ